MRRTSRSTSTLKDAERADRASTCALSPAPEQRYCPAGVYEIVGEDEAARGCRSTPRIASTARPATSRTRPRTSTGSCPKAEEGRIIPTCKRCCCAEPPRWRCSRRPARRRPVSTTRARSSLMPRRAPPTASATLDEAARGYAAALALAPDNDDIAARALSEAIAAGDRPLALSRRAPARAAATPLPPDARCPAARRSAAQRRLARAPAACRRDRAAIRCSPSWRRCCAPGSRSMPGRAIRSPCSPRGESNPLAAAYAAEHRPLLLLALGAEGCRRRRTARADRGRRRPRAAGCASPAPPCSPRKGDRDGALGPARRATPRP